MAINSFSGKYSFLSNFSDYFTTYNDIRFQTVENAYQYAKLDKSKTPKAILEKFKRCSPAEAKRMGRSYPMREDWEDIKLEIMERLIRMKFKKNEIAKHKLLMTGDEELIEGNHWGDTFWGVCDGVGENHLGKILMKVRDSYKEHRLRGEQCEHYRLNEKKYQKIRRGEQ